MGNQDITKWKKADVTYHHCACMLSHSVMSDSLQPHTL